MGKVSMGIISLAAICMVLAGTLPGPAMASLLTTHFGFPIMVRSGQAFSFSNDLASSTDSESLNIDFPMFDGIMSESGMPDIASYGMDNWPMQGMMAPSFSHMGDLLDLCGFKFR